MHSSKIICAKLKTFSQNILLDKYNAVYLHFKSHCSEIGKLNTINF